MKLAGGDWACVVLPERGGVVARLAWRGRDVLVPLPDGADPNASFAGAFVMAPWTNRLDGGQVGGYGVVPANRPADGTAIHGAVRDGAWTVIAQAADRAVLAQAGETGPWRWRARLSLALGDAVEIGLAIENAGEAPMVFGSGWHPFFLRPAGTGLRFAAQRQCIADARTLPIGLEASTGVDGEGYEGLDTAFDGWDGKAVILRPDMTLALQARGAWSRCVQVFCPPGAGFLCVEPVSHLPDAVNRAWLGGMDVLAPGAALAGALTIAAG